MASKKYPSAEPYVPDELDHDTLADAAADCQGCPLYKNADEVVFGEGPTDARLMLVGESPGRNEDREGRPFVGRAGGLLDKALEEAGLSRDQVYITNGVKHIRKTKPDGKEEIKTPTVAQIKACRPWLDAEIKLVQPEYIVTLGTRAARSVLGEEVTISNSRGQMHTSLWGISTVVTYHPSAALRHPITARRDQMYDWLVDDFRFAQSPPSERREMRP